MNKAFVREPDEPTHLKCPSCGAIGQPVGSETLSAHLDKADIARLVGSSVCYCPKPECPVGYFDNHEQTVPASAIRDGAYPKQPDGPICTCLGLTAAKITADAAAKNPARVRQALQTAEANPMRCRRTNPSGHPCTAEIQRLYLAALKAAGPR
jgi:hypothetical protein